jgi:hypothetical protein
LPSGGQAAESQGQSPCDEAQAAESRKKGKIDTKYPEKFFKPLFELAISRG